MVDEKCAPYKAKTKGKTCGEFKECAPVAKVLSTKFIGGGWGEVSEKQMMKELLRNGPLSIEFQANKLFQVYKKGILSEPQSSKQAPAGESAVGTGDDVDLLPANIEALLDTLFLQTSSDGENKPKEAKKSKHVPFGDKTLEDLGLSWHNQNHSVLLVGWG